MMPHKNTKKIHIESQKANIDLNQIQKELYQVLDQFYFSIMRIDLMKGTAVILQSAGHPEAVCQEISWTEFLKKSSVPFVEQEQRRLQADLSSERLLSLSQAGETYFSMDIPYVKERKLFCVTFFVYFKNMNGIPYAYVLAKNTSREYLRKHIINMYVYDNCDYFIYLDGERNSFTKLGSTAHGSALPPETVDNYEEAVKEYVQDWVVPEEQVNIKREMSLKRVLSQLERHEVHSFQCGIMDPEKGYMRKRFDYRYYDRSTQMILLSCTDMTNSYLKENEHQTALSQALQQAQTDALTGLLNYQGITEKITNRLQQGVEHGALLFIDLDNFKTVNDTLGHMVGDKVLQQFANILEQEACDTAMVGRFGGDEFIVFCDHVKSKEEIQKFAKELCEKVSKMEYGQNEKDSHVSCSVGIVEIPKDGNDYQTLLEKADDCTYAAKAAGKNAFIFHE